MNRMLAVTVLVALTGCPGNGGDGFDRPDAAPAPDAPPAPPPPPLKSYGQACTNGNQCESGLCIGETTNGPAMCTIACDIKAPNSCRDVDAFCVPVDGGNSACFGTIETLDDLDDAILSVGDSATRTLTPLADADMFQVNLNQLGRIHFTVTPQPGIDVKLEAYGRLGSPLAAANDNGASGAETIATNVQQTGSHFFLVVRNVGQSTGGYTFTVTKVTSVAPSFVHMLPASELTAVSRSSADGDSQSP